MRLPFGETVTVRRWTAWSGGAPRGATVEHVLHGVALAPRDGATDPAARRGAVIPAHDLLCALDVDLEPHDLLERADGSLLAVTGPVKRFRHPMTGWAAGAVAAVTEVVEQGVESVIVYRSRARDDDYGNRTRAPGAGVRVDRVSVEPLGGAEDNDDGQRAENRYRIAGRGLDVLDPFAEVEWPIGSRRRLAVDGSPLHWPWPPATPYTVATLRERR